jgi:hypothetical protein
MLVDGQRHAPAALPPEKKPIRLVQGAGWAPGPVWTGAENLTPKGIRSPECKDSRLILKFMFDLYQP